MSVSWTHLVICCTVLLSSAIADEQLDAVDAVQLSLTKPSSNDDDQNIAFDLPDLTAIMDTPQGQLQIEAFKSVTNDQILQEAGTPKSSRLIWVSVGMPTFVETKTTDSAKLFHMQRSGFFTKVEMLTNAQKKLLAETAKAKYGINVSESQIVNLILSKFECSIIVYEDDGTKYLIKGSVSEFRRFPLRMDFVAPPNSVERDLFLQHVYPFVGIEDIQFTCSMASKGKKILTNTLTITSRQSEQIGLQTKLFGPSTKKSDTVFVTREQTSSLSREMYSTLNIYEDYEIPETEFTEAFVADLINQAATATFSFRPIDTALQALSQYPFDISEDLKPDVIKRDLGEVLKVEKKGDKSRIIVDESYTKDEVSSNQSMRKKKLRLLGIKRSVAWAQSNSRRNYASSKSLKTQLNDLNTESRNDMRWEVEGNKVVPKSLNVAQLSRSNFEKTLVFSRVRVKKIVAPFDREFSLYAARMSFGPDELDAFVKRLSTAVDVVDSNVSSLAGRVGQLEKASVTEAARSNSYYQSTSATVKSLQTSVVAVSSKQSKYVARCRVCFNGSWLVNVGWDYIRYAETSCSGLASSQAWTNLTRTSVEYKWMVSCIK